MTVHKEKNEDGKIKVWVEELYQATGMSNLKADSDTGKLVKPWVMDKGFALDARSSERRYFKKKWKDSWTDRNKDEWHLQGLGVINRTIPAKILDEQAEDNQRVQRFVAQETWIRTRTKNSSAISWRVRPTFGLEEGTACIWKAPFTFGCQWGFKDGQLVDGQAPMEAQWLPEFNTWYKFQLATKDDPESPSPNLSANAEFKTPLKRKASTESDLFVTPGSATSSFVADIELKEAEGRISGSSCAFLKTENRAQGLRWR